MGARMSVAISGWGVFTPAQSISNEELVASFNAYADRFNAENAQAIASGEMEAKSHSSVEFIEKASGIRSRFVLDKEGILDPATMHPRLAKRDDGELCFMAQMAVDAARDALARAGRRADEVDGVICAASNHERAYPAIAVEIQQALGVAGFGFDMNVACSSATFGIQAGADMIRSGSARRILMVNPEICSGHLEWRDRDCHFIFGDVCTAVLLEAVEDVQAEEYYEIVSTRLKTQFSDNIRNNNGFLRRSTTDMEDRRDMQFMQEGRKVFKDVVPMVSQMVLEHLADEGVSPDELKRLWLHQANKSMNDFIGRKVLGREPREGEQPNILQDYANTSSAGSVIAFALHQDGLVDGDLAIICSFGAGYSVGNVIVRKRVSGARTAKAA